MFAKPQTEHQWFDQLVGHWSFVHDCIMPDGSKSMNSGTMDCRSLGGLWLICESKGQSSEGDWVSVMTLGFDPAQSSYVGTFVGSMMTNLWLYKGILDSNGKRLPLETVGPSFTGKGFCKYRDTIELVDKDTWILTSAYESEDGDWVQFLSAKHTRI